MKGGMRFDGNDIRRMPLSVQEQLGAAILEKLEKATPVAASLKPPLKVKVRKLRFENRNLAMRYLDLRCAANRGMIYDLVLRKEGEYITSLSYGIEYSSGKEALGIKSPSASFRGEE